jgi:predicted lipid-binding transport protein (Tim44 family)
MSPRSSFSGFGQKVSIKGGKMQFLDFGTLFFIVAAVVVLMQLRSVLGKRTGNEKPPFNPYAERNAREAAKDADAKPLGNVVSLPVRKGDGAIDYTMIDSLSVPGSLVNKGLRSVRQSDPGFDPAGFLDGAKMAYEMIVTAFADGDRKALKGLLAKDVYDGFEAAIAGREQRGEKMQSSFVGINKIDFADAEVKNNEAHITLRIVSQLISATLDKDGKTVDGDPDAVSEVKDVWTFARDLRSKDPNWKLIATEAED